MEKTVTSASTQTLQCSQERPWILRERENNINDRTRANEKPYDIIYDRGFL